MPLLLLGITGMALSAFAAPSTPVLAPVTAVAGDSIGVAAVRMLGMLALIIAAVLGAGRWMRQSRLLGSWTTPQARLQIVETRSVGQRQALCLVACDQREWLVAVGPSGIQMLAPLQAPTVRPGSFQEHLDGVAEFPAVSSSAGPVASTLHS